MTKFVQIPSFQPNTCPRDVEGTFQRIAFVLTDGESADEQATIEAAERVHDAFITSFAISVGPNIRYRNQNLF